MASKAPRWQLVVLALLAVVAVMLVVTIWPGGTADTTGNGQNRPRDPAVAAAEDPAVPPPLGLDRISAQRVAPANRRDLFRFGSAAPAPARDAEDGQADGTERQDPSRGAPEQAEVPAEIVAPPVAATIPLRYVGYAETPGSGKVAALSDGRFMYHGREGDVIEGRWRVVQIGVESLVIERVDGTGRQTLRLAGG